MAVAIAASGACAIGDNVPQEGKLHIYSGDRIAMWGDSIGDPTWLYWQELQATTNAFYNSRGLTPPTWIQRHAGGATTTYIAHPDQQGTAIADAPAVVILEIGINDIPSISRATSTANIQTWWTAILLALPGLRAMMLSPWEKPGSEADIRLYRTDYAAIARDRGMPFIDLRSYQDVDGVNRTADGIHPANPSGRAWISSKVLHQIALHEGAAT